jgi:type IV secretory pathway VirB2 component (pilin)
MKAGRPAPRSRIVYGIRRFKGLGKALLSASTSVITGMSAEMSGRVAVVLYVVAMIAIIVGVDIAFFRNRFWERLLVNIGIVLVFAAFYLRFLKLP